MFALTGRSRTLMWGSCWRRNLSGGHISRNAPSPGQKQALGLIQISSAFEFQTTDGMPSSEIPLSWNKLIRLSHRWLSIVFTLTVIANFVARAQTGGAEPSPWITYSPLPPLAVMLLTGLYLFALPYIPKQRGNES